MRRHRSNGASDGAPFAHHGGPVKKVVLAFTGGLDTSVAVAWLREHDDAEVITLTVDVGGGSLRDHVAQRALAAGASKAYVVDGRDRFLRRFVFPSLQANALYQDAYPLATALARPLIAQLLVEVAERERAAAVAHGCTGKGNDQVRFDVAVRALDPRLEVIAPMRVGTGLSRDQEVAYARERGMEVPDLGGYSRRFARWHWMPESVRRTMQAAIEERYGLRWSELEIDRVAPCLTADALVIHDRRDRMVPFKQGARFARTWRGARLLATEGLGHNRILQDRGVVDAAVDFVRGGSGGAPVAVTALPHPAPLY